MPRVDEGTGLLGSELNRREFLRRTAALGLSAGALVLFDAACSMAESLAPTATVVPPADVGPASSTRVDPTTMPTAAPKVVPSATPNLLPSSTPPPTTSAGPTTTPGVTPAQTAAPTATPGVTPDQPAAPTVINKGTRNEIRLQIGHLLRRAGFGAGPGELETFIDMGVADTVDYLIDYRSVDDSALEERLGSLDLDLENLGDLQRWAMLRMIYTKRQLQEKMVLFWHGMLTSAFKKVGRGPYMLNQDQLFREQALGNYPVLLKAVSRDPAMLIWLDSRVNKKSAPNENFARELMELFSMGPGPYTEKDVRESARAFTGSLLRRKVYEFAPSLHDNGVKTFLGNSGNFNGDDIIDLIMEHPATSPFISRKLFSFFAYDDPDAETVTQLAAEFTAGGFSVEKLVRRILTSPEFYSDRAYRTKIKSPPELVASAIRTLGIETDGRGLNGLTARMGMILFNPFDVSGWPGGPAWINSSTLLQRINFANRVATARRGRFFLDLQPMIANQNLTSAENGLDYFISLLLDGNISKEEHSILISFAQGLDGNAGIGFQSNDENSGLLFT